MSLICWSAAATTNAEPPRLAIDTDQVLLTVEVVSQKYCGNEKDLVPLQLQLRLTARNVTDKRLILARHPALGQPAVAATAEQGRRGEWEVSWPSGGTYTTATATFGDNPSPSDFVVLAPDEQFAIDASVGIMVQPRWAERVAIAVTEDSAHAFAVNVHWWSPFASLSDVRAGELAKRWARVGDLVTGTSRTPWTEFRAPTIPSDTRCPSEPQARKSP